MPALLHGMIEARKRSTVQPGRVVGDRGRLVQWNTESGLSVINSCGRDLTSGAAHVLPVVCRNNVCPGSPRPSHLYIRRRARRLNERPRAVRKGGRACGKNLSRWKPKHGASHERGSCALSLPEGTPPGLPHPLSMRHRRRCCCCSTISLPRAGPTAACGDGYRLVSARFR
ncbi:hypothetical protein HPB50_004436 [Hyalomma asiaticum]|uniref:Uncharacterized protein n=1 Tax=Hyalomma asiaticum TaxID=266040 RepID=A0ACB7TF34_HYAAI|nr:hypothetical protein HPB50_004436 [Hyalomma asiaticum]